MLPRTLLSSLLCAIVHAQTLPLELIYQFENSFVPVAGYVNIENVAVRSSTGQLLLSLATEPTLVLLDPANPVPEKLVTLPEVGSLLGIAETSHDVFTVAAGNFSFGPQVPGGIAGVPGSYSVWSIDLNGPQAVATQIVAIPEAGTLNGLTMVDGQKDVVLIADSLLGAVWSVNVKTGAYATALQDPAFLPTDEFRFGINGIRTHSNNLYWTNSARGTYGSVALNHEGYAAGGIVQIAEAVNGTNFDDFALDKGGNAWIATPPNAVYVVTSFGQVILAAGGGDDAILLSPTSAVFKGCTLYVVTGGIAFPEPTSGQVFALDVCQSKQRRRWINW